MPGSRIELTPNELDIQTRLAQIFLEYPFLKEIFERFRQMEASLNDWIDGITALRTLEQQKNFQKLVKLDPNLTNKFRFMISAAISENGTISVQLRKILVGMIFERQHAIAQNH